MYIEDFILGFPHLLIKMHLDNTSSLEAEVIFYTQLLLLRHEHHYLPKEAAPEKNELSLSGCPSVPLSIFGAFNEWVLRL